MRTLAFIVFPVLLAIAPAFCLAQERTSPKTVPSSANRTWTDATGKFSVEAEFVSLDNGVVKFKKPNGSALRIPLEKLSKADQEHIRSITSPPDKANPFEETTPKSSGQGGSSSTEVPSPSKAAETPAEAGLAKVIAEGMGATPDEALKDAYRNAVRQVVGAVVDADTMVKNDEVIDDKVLTYSDGFIKKYEEVPGSKKQQGGLHRIKITAQVERRSVVAKLKAANITVKEIEGKSIFAEAVTQLDAEKNVEELLRKGLKDFPQNCLTASVIGKPKLLDKDATQATIALQIRVEPDLKAYRAFSERLQLLLDKMATDKGEFSATFKEETETTTSHDPRVNNRTSRAGTRSTTHGQPPESRVDPTLTNLTPFRPTQSRMLGPLLLQWMPKSFNPSQGMGDLFVTLATPSITLALGTQRTAAGDRIEYRYYLLDKSVRQLLVDLAYGHQGSGKLSLVDSAGGTVTVDRFELSQETGDSHFLGTLITPIGLQSSRSGQTGLAAVLTTDDTTHGVANREQRSVLFLISPVFFCRGTIDRPDIRHVPALNLTRKITLSLDELKSVQSAKCEITFGE